MNFIANFKSRAQGDRKLFPDSRKQGVEVVNVSQDGTTARQGLTVAWAAMLKGGMPLKGDAAGEAVLSGPCDSH